jgi:DNA-binding CsgD family transcriptional regulator
MVLSQRSAELHDLAGLLNEARSGHGRAVLVSAVAGAGKTALLHEFWARLKAEGEDIWLLTASCSETEADLPYAMLSQLFEGLSLGAEENGSALEVLEEAAGATTALAARKVARTVLELAEQRPVVICVDDAHNADRESIAHLLRLIRGMHAAKILAVLTARTRPFKAHSLHIELLRQPHVRLMQLELLSLAGVREMIGPEINTDGDSGPAPNVYALTGGNPMLVRTLLDDMRAAGERGPVAGAAFGHAVLGCVYSAGRSAVEIARGLALLGDLATPSLVSRLLNIPLDTVTRVLVELEAIGLVRECKLRHPAAAQAVLGDMPPAERMAGHTNAARLSFEVAGPRHTASHLLQANTAVEPWMVEVLIDAAEWVLDSDPEQAKAFLELARRHSTGDARRQADIAAGLARIELLVRPSAVLRLVPMLFSAISDGHIAKRVALDMPEILFWYGRAGDNARLFEQVVRLVDADDPATITKLLACRALLTTVFPSVAERIPQLPRPATSAEPAAWSFTANGRLIVFDKLRSVLVNGPAPAEDVRALERALSVTKLSSGTSGLLSAALAILIRSGEIRLAEKWTDHLLNEASDRGAAHWQGMMAEVRARIALFLGDLDGAERYTRLGLRRIPEAAWGVSIGAVYATLLRALTEMGRVADATELLGRALPSALFDSFHGLEFLNARGDYYLAIHQPSLALREFEACGRLINDWKLDQSVTPWRCGAVHALLATNEGDAARALAEEQLALLSPRHPSRIRGMALRALAAAEPADRRPPLLTEAITLLEEGDRLELAKTYRDLTVTYHQLNSPGEVETAARAALHAATECRAAPLAEEVAMALHGDPAAAEDLTTVDKATYHLSAAERRVFLLAASGQTNREIATKLYITVSTVEQHLTRIYRKLRVRGRKDLHAKVAAIGEFT